MSDFTKPYIEILMANDRRQGGWVLTPVKYYTEKPVDNRTNYLRWHEIPGGMYTDGLSVIWFLSFLFGKWGRYLKAALFHDSFYQQQSPRKWADQEFYNMLLILKCPKWKARLAYMLLRTFGWIAYNKYKNGYSHLPQCPISINDPYPTK